MRYTPAFAAAIRLAEFANLEISRENWRTLFRYQEGLKGARTLRDIARPCGSDDLWARFVEGIRRYGNPPLPWAMVMVDPFRSRAASTPKRRTRRDPGASPLDAWPSTLPVPVSGGASPPVTYQALVRLQVQTQKWLELLCEDDADVEPLVGHLRRHDPGSRFFDAEPAERTTKWLRFGFGLIPSIVFEPLNFYLDGLFIEAAQGGFWSRFYRCEYADCRLFNVTRLRRDSAERAPSRFCVGSATCRSKHFRERVQRLRSLVLSEVHDLQRRGIPGALERVGVSHGLTARQLSQLLRGPNEGRQ